MWKVFFCFAVNRIPWTNTLGIRNQDQEDRGTNARIHLPDYAEQNECKRANDVARRLSCGIFRHATLWLKPVLVGQFEFVEWTPDGHLRHSRFLALRDDKQAREVRREQSKL
jgi:ATP-dependent DNA ligase